MSFTFQINDGLTFHHDEYLLNKAEENKPVLHKQTVTSSQLCTLMKDETKLEGYTTKTIDTAIESLKMKKDDTIIIDFHTHYVGHFSIDIDHTGSPMDSPLYIRLRFAEVPAELAHQSDEYDGWLARGWIQEEYIHLDELPAHLSLPRRYAFRYVEIKVIDTSPKWQVIFSHPTVVAESSADDQQCKAFALDDQALQKIYDVGVKTLHDCMTDVFEDGPKRDRRLWLGDLYLQAKANYVTYGNKELVKRCLYLFAGTTVDDGRISANVFVKPKVVPDDTFLFDYSLFFITTLYDYQQVYHEKELLDDLYPIAKKQMDYSLQFVHDGLLTCPKDYPVFVDWSNEFNKDTCAQVIMIYALKQFIALGALQNEEMESYTEILEKMIAYTKEHLYDASRHLFKALDSSYNIATQSWAVLAGIFPMEENKKIMQACIHDLFPIRNIATPYMYHYITEALFISGLHDEAIKLIKNYWGKMIDLGADTYWEAFDVDQPDYSPYGSPIISSYCHAWGCGVVYLLNKYMKED